MVRIKSLYGLNLKVLGVIKEHTIANDYFDPSFEPRDFIDAYQVEMIKAEKSGTSHYFRFDLFILDFKIPLI